MESQIPVKVALRCRPPSSIEDSDNCITFIPDAPQLLIVDKPFTYDYVFNPLSKQIDIYEKAIAPLVESIFKGYNATVLAYGQTGSGKTHTMGGGWGDLDSMKQDPELVGVIPRVIEDIYSGINSSDKDEFTFTCRISYMELYKETLIDLLIAKSEQTVEGIQIREDINGPKPVGLKILEVSSQSEMLAALDKGAHGRTTGSTAMNMVSSRSHAIFTIYLDKTSVKDPSDTCSSKFHLVDLAGSERAKRTKAEGSRFKEGVNINMGLLSLGNVISALGEDGHRHIPYRDSKLTRLLQDSLGGNSHTLMIACISPALSNHDETLSCLRYANRARMIKNKPIVNRDPQVAEILKLKALVASLRDGVSPAPGSKRSSSGVDSRAFYDLEEKLANAENVILTKQNKINSLSSEIDKLSVELTSQIDQNLGLHQRLIDNSRKHDDLQVKLRSLMNRVDYSAGDHEEIAAMMSEIVNFTDCQQEDNDPTQDADKSKQIDVSAIKLELVESGELNTELEEACDDVSDTHKQHALSQALLARELNTVNELLNRKQQLMTHSDRKEYEELVEVLRQHEEEKAKLEKEVAKIVDERDKLNDQLKINLNNKDKVKHNQADKKRIAELTVAYDNLRKKINEQDKLLKARDSSLRKCEKLSSEILNIKTTRVRLIKQMKSDSDTFRKWKLDKEHEIKQFRAKDRKMNAQLSKINTAFAQQQLVMKRKTQEANNANRRLKDALNRQSKAAIERGLKFNKMDTNNNSKRIKNWLAEEIEVMVSVKEAQESLTNLQNDKIEINKVIENIKTEDSDQHSNKKRLLNSGSTEQHRETQISSLTNEIDLKNNQIQQLEERLHEYNAEQGRNTKWEFIKTMNESKSAMKFLMNEVVEGKFRKANTVDCIADYKNKILKLEKECNDVRANQKSMATSLNAFTSQNGTISDSTGYNTPENHRRRSSNSAKSDGGEDGEIEIEDPRETAGQTPLNVTYNMIQLNKNIFTPVNTLNTSDNNSEDGDLNTTMDTTYNVIPKAGRRSQRFNKTPLKDKVNIMNQTTIEE